LGDHQHGAADFLKAEVHLPLEIGEKTQSGDLLGHPIYRRFRVPVGEADEQAKAPLDGSGGLALDRYRRSRDPLQHHAHDGE
jgi:hypothetical protein